MTNRFLTNKRLVLIVFNIFFISNTYAFQSKSKLDSLFLNLEFDSIESILLHQSLKKPGSSFKKNLYYKSLKHKFYGEYFAAVEAADSVLQEDSIIYTEVGFLSSLVKISSLIPLKKWSELKRTLTKLEKYDLPSEQKFVLNIWKTSINENYFLDNKKWLFSEAFPYQILYENLKLLVNADSQILISHISNYLLPLKFLYVSPISQDLEVYIENTYNSIEYNRSPWLHRYLHHALLNIYSSKFNLSRQMSLLNSMGVLSGKKKFSERIVNSGYDFVEYESYDEFINSSEMIELKTKIYSLKSTYDNEQYNIFKIEQINTSENKLFFEFREYKISAEALNIFNLLIEASEGLEDLLNPDSGPGIGSLLVTTMGYSPEKLNKVRSVLIKNEKENSHILENQFEHYFNSIIFSNTLQSINISKDFDPVKFAKTCFDNISPRTWEMPLVANWIDFLIQFNYLKSDLYDDDLEKVNDYRLLALGLTEILDLYIDMKMRSFLNESDVLVLLNKYNQIRSRAASEYIELSKQSLLFGSFTKKVSIQNANTFTFKALKYFESSKGSVLLKKLLLKGNNDTPLLEQSIWNDEKSFFYEVINSLDQNTAYINYQIVGNTICYLTLTKDYIIFDRQYIDPVDLERSISTFRNSIRFQVAETYETTARDLEKLLIPSFDTTIENLVIIPDQQLSQIPFEALLTKKVRRNKIGEYEEYHYLINDYNISYSTSLALKLFNKKENNQKSLLAIAPVAGESINISNTSFLGMDSLQRNSLSSKLPATAEEIQSIADLFNSSEMEVKQLFNKSADESTIKKAMHEYNYLHFATHGFVNYEEPTLSGILLSPDKGKNDGILYADEINQLNLNSELVTLSACETGLGKIFEGEGSYGLNRSFTEAGARNILSSLWKVSDKGTMQLMKTFYYNFINKKSKMSTSISYAKKSMITSGTYSHPYYWSSFILTENSTN